MTLSTIQMVIPSCYTKSIIYVHIVFIVIHICQISNYTGIKIVTSTYLVTSHVSKEPPHRDRYETAPNVRVVAR